MTRSDRIAVKLTRLVNRATTESPHRINLTIEADKILELADRRALLNLQGVAELVKRDRGTVRSWYLRNDHDFPQPAYRLNSPETGIPVWDWEDAATWAETHPELLGR